ncbi:MAG: pyridoxal-phosphate dependent enzyme [Synergistales bacterium]|nr:pyridoxal-phosphate dependent enzyme [Synergistales bacterium]
MLTLSEIEAARERIGDAVHHTPLVQSATLSAWARCKLSLKAENLQKTGAFKIRGALNAVLSLSPKEGKRGVVTGSSGNHGQAVALAAALAGYPATVVMPEDASPAKAAAVEGYGAEVLYCGTSSKARIEKARERCAEQGMTFIHPYDDPRVMAGQGTVGLEIVDDLPDVETVLVPTGGGGLLSGTATAVRELCPSARVIGVEPEQSNSMYRSLQAGEPTPLEGIVSIADGLKTTVPGRNNFPVVRRYVDDIALVSEEAIAETLLRLLERCKLLVEPSGAVAVAALLSGVVTGTGKTVAVLSGGNVALPVLQRLIAERG